MLFSSFDVCERAVYIQGVKRYCVWMSEKVWTHDHHLAGFQFNYSFGIWGVHRVGYVVSQVRTSLLPHQSYQAYN